jgi:hypothetical protein
VAEIAFRVTFTKLPTQSSVFELPTVEPRVKRLFGKLVFQRKQMPSRADRVTRRVHGRGITKDLPWWMFVDLQEKLGITRGIPSDAPM